MHDADLVLDCHACWKSKDVMMGALRLERNPKCETQYVHVQSLPDLSRHMVQVNQSCRPPGALCP